MLLHKSEFPSFLIVEYSSTVTMSQCINLPIDLHCFQTQAIMNRAFINIFFNKHFDMSLFVDINTYPLGSDN